MITDVILPANDGMVHASEPGSVSARLLLYRKLCTSLKGETISTSTKGSNCIAGNCCCACSQRLFRVYQNTVRDGIASNDEPKTLQEALINSVSARCHLRWLARCRHCRDRNHIYRILVRSHKGKTSSRFFSGDHTLD